MLSSLRSLPSQAKNDYDLISLKVLDDSSNTLDTMDESRELSYCKRGISVYIEMGSSFDTKEKNDDNVKNENASAQGINYMEPVEEVCCCSATEQINTAYSINGREKSIQSMSISDTDIEENIAESTLQPRDVYDHERNVENDSDLIFLYSFGVLEI